VRLAKRFLGTSPGQAAFGFLVAQYVRLVNLTTKWRQVNDRVIPDLLGRGQAIIFVAWHGRLMMLPIAWPGTAPLHLLVSRHGDGELIARAMGHFGMIMVRGSTHRPERERDKGGSAAMRELLATLKQGHSVGLTPDGPQGPAMQLSAGVIALARLSGAPIVPVAVGTGRYHALDTWDRFRFALPFSKGAMVFGDPISVARRIDPPAREAARRQVEAALMEVNERADRLTGAAP
jgi:lysophospholipid acyltransferase (LPLAT)-like uncharacterized protein